MMRRLLLGAAAALAVWPALVGEAHKPILSPYTFAEHAGPIFAARCGTCHAPGGVAPMSLLTHEDATPWAESIRLELIAGHMPPWGAVAPVDRFRGSPLTAAELNTLLVWAAGGTPPGNITTPGAEPARATWPMGEPDLVLQPASPVALPADVQDRVVEFSLPTQIGRNRLVRAVDLRSSSPSVARSAAIRLASANDDAEPLLALWLPGDEPTRLPDGAGFLLPAGASLTVRMHYRKSWKQERDAIVDTPSVGLYFADDRAVAVEALPLQAPGPSAPVKYSQTIDRDFSLLAIYPSPGMDGVAATVRITRPGAAPALLVAARPRQAWARRYWLREPMALPRGTRIDVSIDPSGEEGLMPPGLTRGSGPTALSGGITLNGTRF